MNKLWERPHTPWHRESTVKCPAPHLYIHLVQNLLFLRVRCWLRLRNSSKYDETSIYHLHFQDDILHLNYLLVQWRLKMYWPIYMKTWKCSVILVALHSHFLGIPTVNASSHHKKIKTSGFTKAPPWQTTTEDFWPLIISQILFDDVAFFRLSLRQKRIEIDLGFLWAIWFCLTRELARN